MYEFPFTITNIMLLKTITIIKKIKLISNLNVLKRILNLVKYDILLSANVLMLRFEI